MGSLWTEQTHDRETALAQLDDQRSALALAEPGDTPAEALSRPAPGLVTNPNAIFYRTKATYVLWMLRSLIGDTALQNALKLYDPTQDTKDEYFEQLVERTSAAEPANKELPQFFSDWVYHDRGLPEFTITGAYPSQASAPGTFLIAVEVENRGDAGADVPVTVSSANTQVTERLFIPAHGHAIRRLLIQGEPTQVQVNDGIVPETTASVHVQQIHYTAPTKP
jgi:aminopeptidase N